MFVNIYTYYFGFLSTLFHFYQWHHKFFQVKLRTDAYRFYSSIYNRECLDYTRLKRKLHYKTINTC